MQQQAGAWGVSVEDNGEDQWLTLVGSRRKRGCIKNPLGGWAIATGFSQVKKRKKVLPPSSRCVLLKVGGRKEEFVFLQVFNLKMSWVALAEGRGVNRKGPPAPSGCLRSWNDL